MAVRSFLMSFLVRQYLVKRAEFATRYAGAWLIWEPGDWKAPRTKVATTEVVKNRSSAPKTGDALCFQLTASAPGPDATLTIGRGSACDVVLNDATISRSHLQLELLGGRWSAKSLVTEREKAVLIGGRELPFGAALEIGSGTTFEVGGARLTFVEIGDLQRRVAALAA